MKLILESWRKFQDLDEATRRDLIRGTTATAALAGAGASIFNDDEPEPEDIAKAAQEKEKAAKIDYGKEALSKLRWVPNVKDYYLAPATDTTTGQSYVYVPLSMLYDMADTDNDLFMDVDDAKDFYLNWTIGQIHRYVFGELVFWGTEVSDDPNSMKLAQTMTVKDNRNQSVVLKKLPIAWTVSMNVWLDRMVNFDGELSRSTATQKRQLMIDQQVSESSYKKLLQDYERVMNSLNNPVTVRNPNYFVPLQ